MVVAMWVLGVLAVLLMVVCIAIAVWPTTTEDSGYISEPLNGYSNVRLMRYDGR